MEIDARPQYTGNAGFIREGHPIADQSQIVVATFHAACVHADGSEWACGIKSTNGGGQTWSVIPMPVLHGEGNGQTTIDDKTWYFGGNGLYRTTDGGLTWQPTFVLNINGSETVAMSDLLSGKFSISRYPHQSETSTTAWTGGSSTIP